MLFWLAVVLGIVQGFTEFLPVSSSGHLVILEAIFDVSIDYTFLNILLHISTLLAVIYFYRKQIFYLITHPFCQMNKYLVVATLPAVIFVLILGPLFTDYMSNTTLVGIGFLITAVMLSIAQLVTKKYTVPSMLNYKNTLLMGIGQAFAVFPGLSRSGTTLAVGLVAGTERQSALDFSFLMSIPIILASLVYELIFSDVWTTPIQVEWYSILVACISAFITAWLGLSLMQKIIRKINLWYFVPYLIILGVVVICCI